MYKDFQIYISVPLKLWKTCCETVTVYLVNADVYFMQNIFYWKMDFTTF